MILGVIGLWNLKLPFRQFQIDSRTNIYAVVLYFVYELAVAE
jgi:hypothetical protein